MLANVDRGLLLTILVLAFAVAIVVIAGRVIWSIVKARKSRYPNSKRIIFWTLGSIFITAVSWVLNFGWIRFVMTFLLIPIIHGIVYFLANLFFSKYIDKSSKMSKLNLFFIIIYVTAYVFMPDGADVGGMYFFFGLIHNDTLSSIASFIADIAGIGHIVLFIMQIIEAKKIKKNMSADSNL